MGKERDILRRRQLRKSRHDQKRQNSLITDYIQHKYSNVYTEAFHFYERLNNQYPKKIDLRKTEEYRVWKTSVSDTSTQSQVQEPPNPVSIESSPTTVETQPPTKPIAQSQVQEPPNPVSIESSPTTVETQSPTKSIYEDNLQLRIPIDRYRSLKHTQSTTTQTLTIVDEGFTLQPMLFDEPPSDLIDQIIEELRQDPDLTNILDDFSELVNSEGMDINIEIPEYTLLEKELENL